MDPIPVEACVEARSDDAVRRSVTNAYRGGAATVELCADMAHGGLTPSEAHIRIARAAFAGRPGLMVMIRPRPGSFEYDPPELATMADSIRRAADAGADGVVLGALKGRALDREALASLVALAHAHHLRVTFHRAFDALPARTPDATLEALIDLGVARVLTSGTPWGSGADATAGLGRLAALVRQAGRRIEIVVGGGVRPDNVGALLAALPLGAGRVAAHAYGGLLRDGVTDADLVATFAANAQAPEGEP